MPASAGDRPHRRYVSSAIRTTRYAVSLFRVLRPATGRGAGGLAVGGPRGGWGLAGGGRGADVAALVNG